MRTDGEGLEEGPAFFFQAMGGGFARRYRSDYLFIYLAGRGRGGGALGWGGVGVGLGTRYVVRIYRLAGRLKASVNKKKKLNGFCF